MAALHSASDHIWDSGSYEIGHAMKILKLNLNNYKSFRSSGWLDFAPNFTVVVGKNNAGKSALLEAFRLGGNPIRPHRLLERATDALDQESFLDFTLAITGRELMNAMMAQNGAPEIPVPFAPNEEAAREKFALDLFERDSVVLQLKSRFGGSFAGLTYPAHGAFAESHNKVWVQVRGDRRTQKITAVASNPSNNDGLPSVAQFACSRSVYVFRAERLNIGKTDAVEARNLAPDGSNLGAVLGTLQGNAAWFANYNKHVNDIFPSIQQISVAMVGNDFEVRVWSVDPSTEREDLAIPLHESGTGVGQVLTILCVVMTVKSGVIVIDEPNSFLHPGAAKKLIQILKQYDQHQYVLATHSAELISTAKPEIIHLVRWEGGESKVERVDARNVDHLRYILIEVGVSFSDLFGYDRVIWVEGPTEEICFPVILEKLLHRAELGLVFVSVRNTGDFEKKRVRKELIYEIYEKVSSGALLLPSAVSFSFDLEDRTERDIEDLMRQSKGRAYFISRLTYENYLIDPEAIAALINSLPREGRADVTSDQVSQWLADNGGKFGPNWNGNIANADWLKKVHAPSLLKELLNSLASAGDNFEKTSHSKFLTEWLIQNRPEALAELAEHLTQLVDRTS
jgi:predicted ATPase